MLKKPIFHASVHTHDAESDIGINIIFEVQHLYNKTP